MWGKRRSVEFDCLERRQEATRNTKKSDTDVHESLIPPNTAGGSRTWYTAGVAAVLALVGGCAVKQTFEGNLTNPEARMAFPAPLARSILNLAVKQGIPSQVKVTQWGTQLSDARHVLFYFGGMPTSAEEPALHSAAAGSDVYAARRIHVVCIDKPGMGSSKLSYFFSVRRDWPSIVSAVADQLKIQQYGVFGISNGGPYVMACLTHPEPAIRNRVKAGCMVVGTSDVWASGYFSWRNPSCFAEGIYNSLPVAVTGPLNYLLINFGRLYLFGLGGYKSLAKSFPNIDSDDAKRVLDQVLKDGSANAGLGSAIDCQQGLSPLYARSTTSADSAETAYSQISVPVSLWYGTTDSTVPMATAEWLQRTIPNSTLNKVEAGHGLYFSHAEKVLDDFVAKMEAARADPPSSVPA